MGINSGHFTKSMVFGVGVDDTSYSKESRTYVGRKSTVVWFCPTYSVWRNMLKRCYHVSGSYYGSVKVCSEWLVFSNFKTWYESQVFPDGIYHLDKDLFGGTVPEYNPLTCCILPRELNSLIVNSTGNNLTGTCWDKERKLYQSFCKGGGAKRISLGRFSTEMEAHLAWLECKIKIFNTLINRYKAKNYSVPRITKRLLEVKYRLDYHLYHKLPVEDLTRFSLSSTVPVGVKY